MDETGQSVVNSFSQISQWLSSFAEGAAVDGVIIHVLTITLTMAMFLGIIFYLIMLGFNYLKTNLERLTGKDGTHFIDFDELIRTIGILILIAAYSPVMLCVTGIVNTCYIMTKPKASDYEAMVKNMKGVNSKVADYSQNMDYYNALIAKKQCTGWAGFVYDKNLCAANDIKLQHYQSMGYTEEKEGEAGKQATYDKLQEEQGFSVFNLTRGILNAVESLIAQLFLWIITAAKMIIFAITKIWLKLLYVFGPLALAFSILPMFRRQGEIWFGYFLNTAFVFITFNILDWIMYGLMGGSYVASFNVEVGSPAESTLQNSLVQSGFQSTVWIYYTIMLIAYFSAFRITSYYVGKPEAGRAVSKAVSTASDIARLAFFAGGGSIGGGGLAGKVASGMANDATSKGGFRDNT